jgi:hypothetical protein
LHALLAYYTYWFWLNELDSSNYQTQAKNANNINPTSNLVDVWNKFLEMYQGLNTINFPRVSYVNGATFVDYFNQGKNSNYVSLLQFLIDNPTDYPTPQLYTFELTANSNSLGL